MTLILGWLEIIQRLSVHVKVASYYGPSSGAVFHHYIQTSGWDEYAQLEITKLLYSFHKDALLQNNFITCQNLQFWQVCSSDGLFVSLSVCLSVMLTIPVAPLKQSTPNFTHICILDLATCVYFLVLMTWSMTSSGPKIGQIFKLP